MIISCSVNKVWRLITRSTDVYARKLYRGDIKKQNNKTKQTKQKRTNKKKKTKTKIKKIQANKNKEGDCINVLILHCP